MIVAPRATLSVVNPNTFLDLPDKVFLAASITFRIDPLRRIGLWSVRVDLPNWASCLSNPPPQRGGEALAPITSTSPCLPGPACTCTCSHAAPRPFRHTRSPGGWFDSLPQLFCLVQQRAGATLVAPMGGRPLHHLHDIGSNRAPSRNYVS